MSSSSFLPQTNWGAVGQSQFDPSMWQSADVFADTTGLSAPGLSPESASPAKPGSESPIMNGWMGASLLMEGLGQAIRGFRGMEPAPPGMATRMMTDYLAQKRDEDRLNKVLDRLYPKETGTAIAQALTPAPLRSSNPLSGLGSSADALSLAYGSSS